MLKTLREQLVRDRSDIALESLIIDAGFNGQIRDTVMEAMGEGDDELSDEELEKLLADIPESDLDDPDALLENKVVGKDELGEPKDMDLETVAESFIPPTDY